MVNEAQLVPIYGRPRGPNQVPVRVFGTTLAFSRKAANQLLRAAERAYDLDYTVFRIESYNPDSTTPSGAPSAHQWPIAVDINPERNPMTGPSVLTTDMPRAFVDCFTREGFGWGGNWRSSKDPMHFSLAPNEGGTPRPEPFDQRLAARVAAKWRRLHGGVDMPIPGGVQPRRSGTNAPAFPGYSMSAAGAALLGGADANVRRFQQRLNQRGWNVATDGIFSRGLDRVVRAFQREKHLKIDGVVGPSTWRMIWEAPIT